MDELKRLIELLNTALADLEKQGAVIEAFRKADAPDVDRLRKAIKALVDRLGESQASLRAGLAESADIAKRLTVPDGKPAPAVAGVLATDLAKGFRSVLQTLQSDIDSGDVGDVGTIIRSMDVEVKGHIVVDGQQPTIVPPAPGQIIDANQLSTVRMSFASVPRQRALETKPG
jgi:hypothetical protein